MNPDLMLCGHTRRGQLRVPLGEPFAPVEDKRYVAGLNAFGERHIYTSGVGVCRKNGWNWCGNVITTVSGSNF